MSETTLLQIFILIDVFVMGILVMAASRHALAHYHPEAHDAEPAHPTINNNQLLVATREHLIKTAQEQLETLIKHNANQLQHDLLSTNEQINNLVKRLAIEVVSTELQHYRTDLSKLHEQATQAMGGIKKDMDSHQSELKTKLNQEMELEKQRLMKQIDTKLGDAVGSFLLETLGHNVDLGSQGAYLMDVLEEHKAEFTKEVSDES